VRIGIGISIIAPVPTGNTTVFLSLQSYNPEGIGDISLKILDYTPAQTGRPEGILVNNSGFPAAGKPVVIIETDDFDLTNAVLKQVIMTDADGSYEMTSVFDETKKYIAIGLNGAGQGSFARFT